MKELKKYILVIGLIIGSLGMMMAQTPGGVNEAPRILLSVVARSYADSIMLRWATSAPSGWLQGNENGFKIERAVLTTVTDDYTTLNFVPLPQSPVKPFSNDQFADYFDNHPENHPDFEKMAIAHSLIYDDGEGQSPFISNVFNQDLNSLKEERNRLNMHFMLSLFTADQSFLAARASAMGLIDKDVELGKSYIYRVTLLGSSKTYELIPGYVKVKCEPFDPAKYINKIYTIEKDQKILLGWPKPGIANSYYIERSLSATGPFERLNETPRLVQSEKSDSLGGTYMDEGLKNYTRYYYKVIAKSYFGDEILIGEGSAMPRDYTPPGIPFQKQPVQISPNEVLVTWDMDGNLPDDFAGYNIGRSNNIDGPFIQLNDGYLSAKDTSFIDTTFSKGTSNFYVVQAMDTVGNFNLSRTALVTLIDSIPPYPPKFIKGEVDSTGIVRLYLEKNLATDLMGYRVFKANSLNDEPSTFFETFNNSGGETAKDTIIIDSISLNTLTKHIYYYATALDYHYNESPMSEPIKVIKPDTIRPVKPMIGDYKVKENAIYLEIYHSPSKDVVKHLLYRQHVQKETDLTVYRELPKEAYSFVDNTIQGNQTYIYAITAVDDSGLESEMNTPIMLKTYRIDSLPSVVFEAAFHKRDNQVVINWEYEHNISQDYTFTIYRQPKDQSWELVSTVQKGAKYQVADPVKTSVTEINYRISVQSKHLQSLRNLVVTVEVK